MTPRRWAGTALCLALSGGIPVAAAVPDTGPDADSVRAVVLLVGDAGEALRERSPLLHRLRDAVERWSAELAADSSVVVVFLGDNVYPAGVRGADDPAFPRDSARLASQVWVVSGPQARRRGARGVFVAGNHDWGHLAGAAGRARLVNEQAFLRRRSGEGAAVRLFPAAGRPGPEVVDVAGAVRIVALDTEWWLRNPSGGKRDGAVARLRAALRDAGREPVFVVAHHPLLSAGPHGVPAGLGPLSLLRRAGAVMQDANSGPYRRLQEDLSAAFLASGSPLLYAAGHDHSLQVLRGGEAGAPAWMVVSGAGSKGTGLRHRPELVWGDGGPGYVEVVVRGGGAVDLAALVGPSTPACGGDPSEVCLERAAAAFRPAFRQRLAAPRTPAG